MKSKIPIKFLTILLIIDFTLGVGIVYQDEIINYINPKDNDCERSKSYKFIGIKWRSFPIEYYLDTSIPINFLPAIMNSFNVWDNLTEVQIFKQVYDPENYDLLVDYSPITIEGVVGKTSFEGIDEYFSDNTIYSSFLTLNSYEDFENIDFSCEIVPINHQGPFDIESITTHELGHVLGLDHTVDQFATMYAYYVGSFQKTLSQGEKDGFLALYDPILP